MAGFHFENELRLALREAARRETQQGALTRSLARARSALVLTRRSFLPATAVAVTMIALAVAAILLTFGHRQPRPVRPPKIVAQLPLADSLGDAVGAYGSLWIDDRAGNRLLRVDPQTRRATARIPVPDDISLAPARGSLWVLLRFPAGGVLRAGSLMRVDPRTGRATARIPLRTPAGDPFAGYALAAGDQGVWILGTTPAWHDTDRLGMLRVDPLTGRVTSLVALPPGWGSDGIAVEDGGLWALAVVPRQRLLRYDARTGSKLLDRRVALPEADLQTDPEPGTFGFAGGALVATIRGGLARIDPLTGRVEWRRPLGQGVQAWTEAGGLIWASARSAASDRLFGVDPRNGRVATSVNLAQFGTAGIAAIGHELWVTTQGGTALVLRR